MSKRFDISTNRTPHGLLEPAEREAIEAAAKVPGAAVVIYNAGRNAWNYCCPTWGEMFVYRVLLPAAVEPPKQEPMSRFEMIHGECSVTVASSRVVDVGYGWRIDGGVTLQRCRWQQIKVNPPKLADAAPDAAPVETWEYEGKRYKLVPDSGPRCEGCVFFDKPRLCSLSPNCGDGMRPDGKNMIFVEDAPAPVPPDAPKPTRIEPLVCEADGDASLLMMIRRLNEIINAVNELRGAK